MKITKIGSFNKQGIPIGWHIDMDKANKDQPAYLLDFNNKKINTDKGYVLGIIEEKVCINGIEIVPWTKKRNNCIQKGE